jgi:hypothetical protein
VGEQDAERLPIAAAAGLGEVLVRKLFAGGASGIELIRLGAVAPGRLSGTVDLDHPLTRSCMRSL